MAILTEKEHIEKINAYELHHWQPLFDLIPEIEAQKDFGQAVAPEINPENAGKDNAPRFFAMPYFIENPVVDKFRKIAYQIPIIIDFDWTTWRVGEMMFLDDDFDYDTIDIPTKCKLLTAFVRSDRFNDGYLISVFEKGLVLKVLKSIEKQLISKEQNNAGIY